MAENNYRVCLYDDGLAHALSVFSKRIWPLDTSANVNRDPSAQATVTKQTTNIHKDPTFLFLKNDDVLGHITANSIRLSCRSRVLMAHWVTGFMVLPEYRDGLIGPLLIKKVNETLNFAMTLHVEHAAYKVFTGLGWKHLGVIPQYAIILNPYRLLNNVQISRLTFIRGSLNVGSRLIERIVSHPFTRVFLALLSSAIFNILSLGTVLLRPRQVTGKVAEEIEFDGSYNTLWEKVGGKFGALVVRDQASLSARYSDRKGKYRLLTCRDKSVLLGYCILKIKNHINDSRMGNTRLGTIIDCLCDPEDLNVLQSLFKAALQLFKKEKVDVIICSTSHPIIQKLLFLNGFIKVPGNLHFAYYDRLHQIPTDLSLASWHLMRGDSDADQNF